MLDQVKSWVEENRLGVILALVGLGVFGSGLFWFKTSSKSVDKVEIVSIPTDTEQKTTNNIFIDISGAVNSPGVYQLGLGSRVEDALRIAGGLTEGANIKWIETNLNRAMVLTDGMKIYIPDAGASGSLVKITSENININSASQSELEVLPGIGPVTAEKIITNRPYQSIEELLSKKILGQKVFDSVKNKLAVW